mmetsp:Transcript_14714/g.18549  ORF Transcript_14714/g.18549 Transcript_14714/m.18549 type:complete len:81 (+) Transcript_14714:275-517(+)
MRWRYEWCFLRFPLRRFQAFPGIVLGFAWRRVLWSYSSKPKMTFGYTSFVLFDKIFYYFGNLRPVRDTMGKSEKKTQEKG